MLKGVSLREEELLRTVEDCLLKFDSRNIRTAVDNALNAGFTPNDIIARIREGFEEVSRKYDAGEFFLSELIMSGETAKAAFEVLNPHFRKIAREKSAKVVIGTVEGDIHDIGKNIVSTILLASGFDVYDLGADVKSHDFVNKIKETDAQILALSALLTTTMQNMRTIIEDLKKGGLRKKVKVIIGGQPITDEFAQQIGADAYVDDAPKVVKAVATLLGGT
jgi:corrinoid protein of di/trimethylamine methyltransferase